MHCKTQVALAAGIGYLLGRQRKLRWGLLLGAAIAAGRFGRPGSLVEHGLRALKSTPELGKLGEMGAPLVNATKEAAKAAVTGRIASVSDRLRDRTSSLLQQEKERKAEEEPAEEEEAPRQRDEGRAPRRRPRRRPPAEEAEEEERYEREEEPEDEEDYEEEEGDQEEEEEEEEEEEPVSARVRSAVRAPVRRRR
ncbi:hypothetical protein [Dactylosporangium sp. CA-139066]|uniref:hypothetical protein n=1 Tax=Dactylosporangium sp. CA-139066 TaxID=3239930 RepID=UPI003D933FA6